ncbi:MAG: hypothetical protein H0X45_14160 [Planctomycetes bacterium]|nr:hypothetical protein [Planctomycetota bacterium]
MRRFVAVILALMTAPSLHAGMPSVRLDDLAKARFETISFFLLMLLLCAALVRWLWNALTKDLPKLPRLTYGRALAMTVLWGLAGMVVLTMISGARELMTPGAWERRGATYALTGSVDPAQQARKQRLEAWRDELWRWSEQHGGVFPPHDSAEGLDSAAGVSTHPSRSRFVYVPGVARDSAAILSYEPGVYGRDRWTLFADGQVELLPIVDLRQRRMPAAP